MVCHFHQGPHIYISSWWPKRNQRYTKTPFMLCNRWSRETESWEREIIQFVLWYGLLEVEEWTWWDIGLDWIIYRISTHHKNKIREKKHMLGNPMEFTWLVLWVSFCLLLLLWIFCPTTTCPSCMYVWTLNARLLQKNIVEDSNRVHCCWNNNF